jgi:hypothetical protein
MHTQLRLLLLVTSVLVWSMPISGRDPLQLQISPTVSRAPAFLTVRATIDPSDDNRALQITAESIDFFRSSEVSLDGANSSPLSVFEFRNLPTGTYQVTGVLIGARGPRGTAFRTARVEPSVGGTR